jgi:hypothetical protein
MIRQAKYVKQSNLVDVLTREGEKLFSSNHQQDKGLLKYGVSKARTFGEGIRSV